LKHEIEDALKAASEKRHLTLLGIRNKAAIHLEHVRNVTLKCKKEKIETQVVLVRDIMYRQAVAADRKRRITMKVQEAIRSNSHKRQVTLGKDSLDTDLKKRIEQKLNGAFLRRKFKLQAGVIRLREIHQKRMSKSIMVKRIDFDNRKYIQDVLEFKLASAYLRRKENHLKKYKTIKARNALSHYKVEWNNRSKANQKLVISEAIERKLKSAAVYRESFLRSKSLKCSSMSNVERVMDTRGELLRSSRKQLEDKLKNKMDANSARYQTIIRDQRDKCLQFHAHWELVLMRGKCMANYLCSSMIAKQADRCRTVDQKRRLLLVNRVEKLAMKRFHNSMRGAEAKKFIEQDVFDTFDRLILKQLTASERKQAKIHQVILKARGTPLSEKKTRERRSSESLNVSYTKSLHNKTRDEIDLQLHDAAERREALLLMRAEQAGYMGSRRSPSNFSPAFIRSCELSSYTISSSSPSSSCDKSAVLKPLPQCCIQWESPKPLEKTKDSPVNCLNLWLLDVIFQFFVHISGKLPFVRR